MKMIWDANVWLRMILQYWGGPRWPKMDKHTSSHNTRDTRMVTLTEMGSRMIGVGREGRKWTHGNSGMHGWTDMVGGGIGRDGGNA